MSRRAIFVALLLCCGCHLPPIQFWPFEPTTQRYQDTVAIKARLASRVHIAIGTVQEADAWRDAIDECKANKPPLISDCAEEDFWVDGGPIPYVSWNR